MTSDQELRDHAADRLRHRQTFKVTTGGIIITWIICIAIWALTGAGDFWPIWVIFSGGVVLLYSGWSAYGPRSVPITDADIDAEARRMQRE